jgi:L-ascorbate metabolism protein UlaG (beta-lactamase superfamily)
MHVHKLGHCCLVIETNSKRIMTDPGNCSTLQDQEKNIDIVLITHEHQDHLHMDSLKAVLINNPHAVVITNSAVGKLLTEVGISHQILEHTDSRTEQGILIESFDGPHEEIYKEFGQVQNTGYFVDNKLFYPGDAFTDPGKHIDILALPVSGPWMRLGRAIEYTLALKPRVVFPVHDGILKNAGMPHRVPGKVLPENGIEFVLMIEGDQHDF